jgi:HK97 family phage portal protein
MGLLERLGLRKPKVEVKRVGNQVPLVESYRDMLPLMQPYTLLNAIENDIKRNPFLYSALRKKAESIASVPFYVERFEDGQWVRVVNHEAEHLIEGANPFMSGYELKKLIVYHKELTGSSFTQIVSVDGKPVFLQPLFPQFVRVVPSQEEFIAGFEYVINGNVERVLTADEVLWTKYPDPADAYKGLSPLQSISGEMQTDLEARKWNAISLSNRGSSDVAFIMRGVVTEEDYQLARTMIEDRISGPDNARRPWILGGDSDVRPLSYTAVEMDYINTRKFNREVISAALGVPAPLIGASDNSTYNNLDTLKRDFWQDTITTWLEEFRQDLTRQVLLPYYGDFRRRTPTLRYMYDLSNIDSLQQNMKEKADIALTLRQAGYSLRSISQLLELGIAVEDESPSSDLATPTPEPDDVVIRMARVAVNASDDAIVFADAIVTMHAQLARVSSRAADLGAARKRASAYLASGLSGSGLVDLICAGEVSACKQ